MHPWLEFTSPVPRPSFASQGWANARSERSDIHRGLDLRVSLGTPIYAVGDGVVAYARADYEGSDAGNWVGIRHADEMLSRYLHLQRMLVSVGEHVSRGQLIGYSGCTGTACAGPHLHFDVILPKTRLGEYAALFGTPASGFIEGDFGVKVPAEPLIPIDRYDSDVAAGMRDQRIFAYAQIRRDQVAEGGGLDTGTVVLAVGVLALGAAGVYFLRSALPRWT